MLICQIRENEMMQIFKSGLLFLLVVTYLVFSTSNAHAMKIGMRCDGGLINLGDSVFKVVSKCGKPDMEMGYKGRPITYYYSKYGMEYKLSFKNGDVSSITRSR